MKGIIKYRAWREQTNEIFDVQSITWDSNGEMKVTLKEYSETSRNTTYPEDEITLMQFTGHADKNGVEIFEGDICTTVKDKRLIIQYIDGGFRRVEIGYEYKYTPNVLTKSDILQYDIEIIGNIHDDKNLLK